jgi:predicted nucleic acid-binding protein
MFMAEVVDPDSARDPELRDRSDQLVPATFRAAQAQYLITGDKDLLALAHKYPILSPADFWSRHAG